MWNLGGGSRVTSLWKFWWKGWKRWYVQTAELSRCTSETAPLTYLAGFSISPQLHSKTTSSCPLLLPPQLVQQHETALCTPRGNNKVCMESKVSSQNHFSGAVQKETQKLLVLTLAYKKAHCGSCRTDQRHLLQSISLANLFWLHSSMRLRSCFLLAKMLSIEFIQAHIQNSSDHHENFDEKRRNRFACITKHAWHMTYLSWQALEFQCEFPPCPQLVRQHETALCMPGADKVCFESKFSWQNHFSWTVQKETKAACMSWHRQLLTKRHTVCVLQAGSTQFLWASSLVHLPRQPLLLAQQHEIEVLLPPCKDAFNRIHPGIYSKLIGPSWKLRRKKKK